MHDACDCNSMQCDLDNCILSKSHESFDKMYILGGENRKEDGKSCDYCLKIFMHNCFIHDTKSFGKILEKIFFTEGRKNMRHAPVTHVILTSWIFQHLVKVMIITIELFRMIYVI